MSACLTENLARARINGPMKTTMAVQSNTAFVDFTTRESEETERAGFWR
jgi:hypothetical protein